MTPAEKRYLARVACLPCLVCEHMGLGETPADVHHIIEGQRRVSHYCTVPLCPEHHRGESGIHKLHRHEFEARYKLSVLDLLAMTNERLQRR